MIDMAVASGTHGNLVIGFARMRDRDISWPKAELGRMFKRAAKQPGIIVACWYFGEGLSFVTKTRPVIRR